MTPETESHAPFYLRPFGQDDAEADYALLHVLSNFQVPQDPAGNLEWQRNRRLYDESKGARRHFIAVHRETEEPIGYACLEQQGPNPDGYRMYLVFNPSRWTFAELGEFMYAALLCDAAALSAKALALVEYANDEPFLAFLHERGFTQIGEAVYNGFAIVRLEKRL